MSRFVELHPDGAPEIRRTVEKDRRCEEWLTYDIEQSLSARHPQEEMWRDGKRQYAAIPRHPYRNTPVPNAPNIEVPLGAIATDAQYAAITDVLYSGSPLLSARAQDDAWVDHAKAAQRWINYVVANEFGLREATDHTFFDCCQLGTGAFYIPFVENIYKHRVYSIRDRGPRILPLAPENLILPGGSRGLIERDKWVAIRFWYQPDEMRLRSRFRGWDMTQAIPVASIDWVRRRHEQLGLTDSASHWREMYEVLEVYAHFDYNNDGEDLDLRITWDRSSRKILEVAYNPYDTRPIEMCRYQLRPHLAYGLGIMEMLRPFQEEASEVHNHRTLNMMIANARVWIALQGAVPESMEIWPNKVVEVSDINAVKELRMGEVYPSSLQAEVAVTALAERRVGMEGGPSGARPSSIGTRTPGITALSVAQSQNRRFTPAFDGMKSAACGAVRQGLMRQRERIMMNDDQVEDHIRSVLGDADASLVVDLLRQPDFDKYVQVEFTAVSASINREADRQNAMLVANMQRQYYSEVMQLVMAISNPQTPPEVVKVAMQVAEKSGEAMERFLRTFEQFRDPHRFILEINTEAGQIADRNQGLAGVSQLLAQVAGPMGGGGAPPGQTPVDTTGGTAIQ